MFFHHPPYTKGSHDSDTETELMIQQALERLMVGRTTIIIAHRLSTIRNADKIVVLEGKHISETGTHRELMALEGGLYKHLNEVQLNIEPRLEALRLERDYTNAMMKN